MLEAVIYSSDFWYTVSFVIFCGLGYKYGAGKIGAGLDAKIAEIAENIKASEQALAQASELANKAQRNDSSLKAQTEKLLAEARLEAKTSATKILQETEEEITRRRSLSLQHITDATQAHIRAIQLELTAQVVQKSKEVWQPQSLVATQDLTTADFGMGGGT